MKLCVFDHYSIIPIFHHSNCERSELILCLWALLGQFLICLLNLFKTRFRKGLKFVTQMLQFIRMVFAGKFPVSVLYFFDGCTSVNSQYAVWIPFPLCSIFRILIF